MPTVTNRGKVYSTDELIRLATINSFGTYNTAIHQALVYLKYLEDENIKLRTILKEFQDGATKEDQEEGSGSSD